MRVVTTLSPNNLAYALDMALTEKYAGNVVWSDLNDFQGRRDGRWSYPRFTLQTRDAWAYGSRTAASGRHMRKASWEAHREALAAIFDADPGAFVHSALADYHGRDDFLAKFPATGDKNIGSRAEPVAFADTSV